ncbi:hypothetical protein [Burkholderia sp. Ac-20365]|uniref:hypothetical protein n=1 Tax=Burkholderia sp. Ac-20365 TaxID=2703897 RepID=UPI00197BEAC6|nr:hypothetical protein [Burkholderia sp. Ac-20365]MBN3767863.1 hypothetical protein [Burkholderia sp. Ac-20365]
MKGIPEVNVVVARNDLRTAFELYDPCTRTRIAVSIDCAPQRNAVCTEQCAPVYATRAYRISAMPTRVGLRVRYPRCAGWSDGFGAMQR